MNLTRYIQIIIGVILLMGVIFLSSAGMAETGNDVLIPNNAGNKEVSVVTIAGSLLDMVTGSPDSDSSLPIANSGPVSGGNIYAGPSDQEGLKKQFTIIVSAGGGGTITPLGTVSVQEGDSAYFSIAPDSGYEIRSVLIDGEDVGAVAEYRFPPVYSDHQIEARFRAMDKESTGTLEGGMAGAFESGQKVGDPLVSDSLDSVSKTAIITIAEDPPFYSEGGKTWQVRKAHTIRNPHDAAQTDYMVRFIVHRTTRTDNGEDCSGEPGTV